MKTRDELEYYLGRRVTDDAVAEAEEWVENHPGGSLAEYVDAMLEIGGF